MDAILTQKASELAEELATTVTTLEELDAVTRSLMKATLERILNSELEVHLGRGVAAAAATEQDALAEATRAKPGNRKNGTSPKTVQGKSGKLALEIPRDRNGTFEPELIGKHQRRLPGFDEKILALYAKGMTTRDIQELVKELYGVEISPTLVSQITEDLDAEVKTWQTRRLEAICEHTMYVALGVNFSGKKELLGLWLDETEGAKFWLACLTDLKNRGVEDIFLVCVDGLSGFPEAIQTAYPQARVQLCIVHLVRAALRYVSTQDSQAVIADLKKIYQAASVLEAEEELQKFAAQWDAKYPTIAKQWRAKWPHIATMFELPPAIRKAIYTTNAIESVNSVIRKFTRNRKQYPNRESALKLVYMAIHEASKRWTMPIRKWKEALNHFAILFEGRMPANLPT
jgi:putative transposase